MGRGRAKAKQQKVARELKYSTHNTDLSALQRELGGYSSAESESSPAEESDTDEYDEYDDWAGTAR